MSKLPDPFREGLARGWKATHGEQGLPSQIECDVAIVGTGASEATIVRGGTVSFPCAGSGASKGATLALDVPRCCCVATQAGIASDRVKTM